MAQVIAGRLFKTERCVGRGLWKRSWKRSYCFIRGKDMHRKLRVGKEAKARLTFEEILQKTISGLFLERVKQSPKNIAFPYKDRGIYKEVTWG